MNKQFSIFNFQFSINLKNNKKGTALFMTLMILSGVLIVTLGAANLITSGLRQGQQQNHSTKAYFAAEAGAERVLWEIRQATSKSSTLDLPTCDVPTNYIYVDFGQNPASCDNSDTHEYILANNASYKVIYKSDFPNATFESVGDYSDVKRSVEVGY